MDLTISLNRAIRMKGLGFTLKHNDVIVRQVYYKAAVVILYNNSSKIKYKIIIML